MGNRYVVLDRDGTLIEHVHHLSRREDIKFFEDSVRGLHNVASAGYRLGVVTNQSIINRGIATFDKVIELNQVILDFFSKHDIFIAFVLVCPHTPDENCDCRKPKTSLGKFAIESFNIDPKISFMVGDQISDLHFGMNLGMRPIGVRNPELKELGLAPFFHDLEVFSQWLQKMED